MSDHGDIYEKIIGLPRTGSGKVGTGNSGTGIEADFDPDTGRPVSGQSIGGKLLGVNASGNIACCGPRLSNIGIVRCNRVVDA